MAGSKGCSIFGRMYGWQVKLCDPSLTHAVPEHCRDEFTQYKVLQKCPVYCTTNITKLFRFVTTDISTLCALHLKMANLQLGSYMVQFCRSRHQPSDVVIHGLKPCGEVISGSTDESALLTDVTESRHQ